MEMLQEEVEGAYEAENNTVEREINGGGLLSADFDTVSPAPCKLGLRFVGYGL